MADQLGPRAALVVTCQGRLVGVEEDGGGEAGLSPAVLSRPGAPAGDGAGRPVAGPSADAFGILHDAFLADVVQVAVPPRTGLEHPVVVVHLVDPTPGEEGAPSCFPHLHVRVGPGAQAGVVEVVAAVGGHREAPALVVPVADLEVEDGARLAYANLQVLGTAATHVGLQRSTVGAEGTLRSFTLGLGGSYARVRTDSELVGQGGRSALLAAYLGVGEQVHDFRTTQDHHAPRTESELLFTGAVADTARSVYSGLIRIRRGARRADARQTNHNLVLSEGAHADSVPNLDIDENDVRCSHASTVGPIDEEQRYYLESRGIEPRAAERLIVGGFFADMAARCPFPDVGRWTTLAVAERLAGRLPAEQDDGAAAPLAGASADG
ncbi:MAG: SufD family Fe-S cluster assembly protein [Acidobacteriota bacterium]|nr:SufD family Fe-S cluster assembly protein [Acidobacteriota bacterium]